MNNFTLNLLKKYKIPSLLGFFGLLFFLFSTTNVSAQCADVIQNTSTGASLGSSGTTILPPCVLCSVTDESNVIDGNTSNYASINIPLGVGGSGYMRIKLGKTYPAGTRVGFIVDVNGGVAGILSGITLRARYQGNPVGSVGSGSLINILGIGGGRNVNAVFCNQFDEVEISAGGLVGVLANYKIYEVYVKEGCTFPVQCGTPATAEICGDNIDNDGDGLVDSEDPDCTDGDGDGVPDVKETADGTDPNDGCSYKTSSQVYSTTSAAWKALDCDNDGLTNGKEVDPDGDGTPGPNGTDPKVGDTDGDGLLDGEEVTGIDNPSTPANPGGMITDPNNKDSDGDGVSDGAERTSAGGSDPLTDATNNCSFNFAEQTLPTSAAWKLLDCDNDGTPNGTDPDPQNPCLPNANALACPAGDTDGDGVTNAQEATDGTSPSDGCSYKTSSQVYANTSAAWKALDCDNDGLTNDKELDPDGDGTPGPNGTDPKVGDSDGDGLLDGEEVTGIDNPSTPANPGGMMTDPNNKDTDGDGASDGAERTSTGASDPLTDATDKCSYNVSDVTLTPTATWNSADCDGDGTPNDTDPDPKNPCIPNANSPACPTGDTDGDGVTNAQEVIDGTDPALGCSYKTSNQVYANTSTAWKALDCDNDGLTNGQEVDPNGDGTPGPNGTDPKVADTDGDGLLDGEEVTGIDNPSTPANPGGMMTDPTKADTDGDGVTDGAERTSTGASDPLTDATDNCKFNLAEQTLATSAAWKLLDCDNDGTPNGTDPDPLNPCIPNATGFACTGLVNPPTITSSPSPVVVGQPTTLTATGCNPGATVTWSNNGVAAGTGSPLVIATAPANASYTATCTESGVTSAPSNTITTGVVTPPVISANPDPIVVGDPATFTATGCSAPGVVTWYNNGVLVFTGNPLVVTNVPANAIYTATCTVGGIPSGPSNPINSGTGVVPAPVISSSPSPLVAGTPATLTATGCASPGVVTWYYNGVQVGTGTPFSTTPTTPISSYYATCTVGGIASAQSNPLAVNAAEVVDLAVTFSVNPGGVFIQGDSKTYTITVKNLSATATSNPTTLQVSNFISGFTVNIGGAKTVNALAPGATQTYTVTLTGNNKGAGGSLTASLISGTDNNSANNVRSVAVTVQNP